MIYVFELFAIDVDGRRLLLKTTKHRVNSKNLALAHGESMMRNLLFNGKRATICAIKNQTGSLIGEVRCQARENT